MVNFRYVDTNGSAGSLIEVVRKLPGSATATHATDWWMFGNQQVVDSVVRSFIRRNEQLAPAPNPPFANASLSRYETGIEMFINKDGPGSTGLRAARVFGPGLPPAGIVLTRPNPSIITDQTWLNIRRKDGFTDPASATLADDVGNVFRLQRTQGLAGAAAAAIQPQPNQGNGSNTAFPNWAHPLDFGAAIGSPSTDYIVFSTLGGQSKLHARALLRWRTVAALHLPQDGADANRASHVRREPALAHAYAGHAGVLGPGRTAGGTADHRPAAGRLTRLRRPRASPGSSASVGAFR